MYRVLGALALLLVLATTAAAAPAPYGTDDAGGFRNVLPPGAAGVDNALQLAAFTATGTRPPHWVDQQPLYENLLYASPTLTHDQIGDYFKDATFGVPVTGIESTTSPKPGVTIVRDAAYGVPHVYGDTRNDVMFGAGYAGAADRLFLMDVLRHTGRAELASFAGGSASNRAMDRTQWQLAPYTEADLQSQLDQAPIQYGAKGQEAVDNVNAYVDGINAYIAAARLNPTLMPGEYAAFGKSVEDWKPTDVVATASLIGGIFGKGGGNELNSAQTLQAFEKRFGVPDGRTAWSDFRSKNDPEAPTTVLRKAFPYNTASPFSPRGLALPDPGSVKDVPVGPAIGRSAPSGSGYGDFGAQLLEAASSPAHASNWELVNAAHSATGHPIGVLGPQVGYYVPQILMEEDLHGGGIDARGAAFPGVNLIVQLGHGTDYAWSATTANTDNVDTFAEVLCGDDDEHYLYHGKCLKMEKLERSNAWTPSVGSSAPAGSETLTALRTVHGIVYARGTVGGKPVAFVRSRTTYFHEADSVFGFTCLNSAACVHDPASFRKAVGEINFGFNWAYIDSRHIAYQQSGWYPERGRRTSPDFPVFGTGQYDWRGFDPVTHTQKVLSNKRRPHAVDQPYEVSWNGKQARGWSAPDDIYYWGPIQRAAMIAKFVKGAMAGGKKVALQQLVSAMEEPASQDIRGVFDFPILRRALGRPSDPALKAAIATLAAWHAAGSHRRDLDKDGVYDDDAAVTLMDAWWPKLGEAMFGPALGKDVIARLSGMVPVDADLRPGSSPSAPAFESGWYGFVSKDLRDLFTPARVRGRWSRVYCGGGSKAKCRAALRSSLLAATKVSKADLYGRGPCASDPQASCFDMNRSTEASAVTVGPFPFQNRPTFQQTVELTTSVPRR
jgi:hypothetical protein